MSTLTVFILLEAICHGDYIDSLGDWPERMYYAFTVYMYSIGCSPQLSYCKPRDPGINFLNAITILTNDAYHAHPYVTHIPGIDEGFPMKLFGLKDRSCTIWSLKSNSEVILSFPGSNNKGDWLTDFHTRQVPLFPSGDSGLVHVGFLTYYLSLETQIMGVLRQMRLKTLILTGHSLGGAVATIACARLAYQLPRVKVVCMTFGSPRVGDRNFGQWYRRKVNRTYRFVMERDPAPSFPSSHKYMHVVPGIIMQASPGTPIAYAPDDTLPGRMKRFSAMARRSFYITTDHLMKTYIELIASWKYIQKV